MRQVKKEFVEVVRFIPQKCSQDRIAEQTVGFSVPSINEGIVEFVLTGVSGAEDPSENHGIDSASASKAHSRAQADSGIPRATDEAGNRGGVAASVSDSSGNRGGVAASVSGAHPRAHRGPEIPKKCRRRKRQKGKPGRDSEEELLEVAMARAREDEHEFLQAVPQDEATKVQQAEVSGDR